MLQELPKRPFTDETDAGAVFLVMHGKPAVTRDPAHLLFVQAAEGKQRFGQCLGTYGVQEVALIFTGIGSLQQHRLAPDDAGLRIMPGREQRTAESFRVFAKDPELDLTITQHIRIGRAASAVLVEEVREYAVSILPREVGMV